MSRVRLPFPFQIAIFYTILGVLWITLSDRLVFYLFPNAAILTVVHTYKGLVFIFMTSLLLYALLKREVEIRTQAEQNYQNIVKNAVVGFFQAGLDGRFINVNPAMAAIFGYDAPEQMLHEVAHFTDQILLDAVERQYMVELLNGVGAVNNYECRIRRRDGPIIWTSVTVRQVRDQNGKTLYFEGFVQDITGRKHTDEIERAMFEIAQAVISTRTLDELYAFIHSALAEIIPAENFYIALYDRDDNLLTFPYFVDQFDQPSLPKTPGRGLTEYVLRSEAPLLASPEVFRDLIERGEVEMIGVDSIDWLGVPLRIGERVIGVMVVQSYTEETRYGTQEMDIMNFISAQVALAIERKRAESAQQESEARYRGLVDNSPIGIMVYCDDVIVFANRSFADMLGIERPEQMLGSPFTDFVHPDHLSKTLERSNRVLKGQPVQYPVENVYVQLDGTAVPTEVVAVSTTYQGRPAVQVMLTDLRERLSAQKTLQRQFREMSVLHEVSQACATVADLDNLFTQVTRIIARTLYPDNCGVILVNAAEQVWYSHPSYHGTDPGTQFWLHPLSEGVIGKTIASARPIRVGDVRNEAVFLGSTTGVLSEMAVPVFVDGQIFAVINAESRQPDAFSEHDERLLTTIADSLATAIQKIQLLHNEQLLRRQAELLREATLALSSPLDLNTRLEVILDKLSLFASFDSASIILEDLDDMQIVAGRGFPEGVEVVGTRMQYTDKWIELIQLQQPIIFPDAQADPRFMPIPGTEYIRGWMGIPLVAYDRVIGFINLDSRQPNAYTEAQAALIQTFANHAAVAIENARLYEAEQRRRKDNARLLDELQVNTFELSMAYDKTLEGWARALEIRDRETSGHTRRVTELTIRLARRFGFGDEEIPHLRRGVLLHDIGKMGIPDSILKKTGPLTNEEWSEMRRHPQYAFDLLHPIAYLRPALDIPYCHHEKWDGSGYPRGLKGEEIPLAARIFAVVDVWDALLHERPYRKAWSLSETLAHIKRLSGSAFDPEVVRVFLEMVELLD